jgi:hypothetical protein
VALEAAPHRTGIRPRVIAAIAAAVTVTTVDLPGAARRNESAASRARDTCLSSRAAVCGSAGTRSHPCGNGCAAGCSASGAAGAGAVGWAANRHPRRLVVGRVRHSRWTEKLDFGEPTTRF